MVALKEVSSRRSLFSFQVEFQEFDRSVVACADQETTVFHANLGWRDEAVERLDFVELKILATKLCVGARPGLESAEAIVDFCRGAGKVDLAIFFIKDWR